MPRFTEQDGRDSQVLMLNLLSIDRQLKLRGHDLVGQLSTAIKNQTGETVQPELIEDEPEEEPGAGEV